MKTENIYCDLCKKQTTKDDVKLEDVNGFCVEIGASMGGWGSRFDLVPRTSMIVCFDCYGKLRNAVDFLKRTVTELKKKK